MRRHIILFAAAALAVGCRGARKADPPIERDLSGTTFPHEAHGGVGCDTCHDAAKWQKLGDFVAPTETKCDECHDDVRKTEEGRRRYTPPKREPRTHYELRFSHADHLERVAKAKGKKSDDVCLFCHQALPNPGERVDTTPPMSTCTSCHHHEVEVSEARCTPCHVSLKRFPVQPITQFTEFSHQANFIRDHGRLAKSSAETCAQCHDQTYCASCHATATAPVRVEIRFAENVRSDFIHRGDYVSRHHFEAERDPASCRKCHGSPFCESCHAANRLSPAVAGARSPHPQGWVARGGAAFHGNAARDNIANCAGCHDQGGAASICVACHAVGVPGRNLNPHPRSWDHDEGDIRDNSMCRACHTNGRIR